MTRPRTTRRSAFVLLTALVIAAVSAVVVATIVTFATSGDGHHRSRPVARPAVTSPSSDPPTSSPPPVVLAAAAPTRFRMVDRSHPGFTIDAHVCSMPWAFDLDPPGEQHHTVCWVRNHIGSAPGSLSTTSYLLGHAWAQDAREVLNPLSSRATKEILADVAATHTTAHTTVAKTAATLMSRRRVYPVHALDGSTISLWTKAGRLDYTVQQVFGVAKTDWGYLAQVHDGAIRNRIVLTTCAERGGVDYPYNIVVEAYLTSSAPTHAH